MTASPSLSSSAQEVSDISRLLINDKARRQTITPQEALLWQHYFEMERLCYAVQMERQQTLDSKSWKFTAPFRKITIAYRRLRAHVRRQAKLMLHRLRR